MSFYLIPHQGESIKVNVWTWSPFVELLREKKVLPQETLEAMDFNSSIEVSSEEVEKIVVFLDHYINTLSGKTKRIQYDFSEEETEDTGELHRQNFEKNYSISVEWLKEFRDFCKKSGGFEVS
jgi:hypothetical protein